MPSATRHQPSDLPSALDTRSRQGHPLVVTSSPWRLEKTWRPRWSPCPCRSSQSRSQAPVHRPSAIHTSSHFPACLLIFPNPLFLVVVPVPLPVASTPLDESPPGPDAPTPPPSSTLVGLHHPPPSPAPSHQHGPYLQLAFKRGMGWNAGSANLIQKLRSNELAGLFGHGARWLRTRQ